jgi:hypothetical protein
MHQAVDCARPQAVLDLGRDLLLGFVNALRTFRIVFNRLHRTNIERDVGSLPFDDYSNTICQRMADAKLIEHVRVQSRDVDDGGVRLVDLLKHQFVNYTALFDLVAPHAFHPLDGFNPGP